MRPLTFRGVSRWAAAVLLAAGCSAVDGAGDRERSSTRAPRVAQDTPAAASQSAGARLTANAEKGTEVQIGDHYVDPQTVTVKAGATVTWRNGSGTHDITARDGSFRSPSLVGDSFSYTFKQPGRYPYWCSIHTAEMRGEVVVEPAN